MRSLKQLIDREDPGLDLLHDWAGQAAGNGGVLLPPDETLRTETLLRLQVTTRSLLGAVVYETGGVLVSDGLLRLFGSGAERSLLGVNEAVGLLKEGEPADVMLIADDVLGGLFALNGGRFGLDGRGEVFHLAPDETVWSPLEVGYSDFTAWCLTGDLDMVYGPIAALAAFGKRPRPTIDEVYSFYPFLWSEEGRSGAHDVRVIDANENLRLRLELSGFHVG